MTEPARPRPGQAQMVTRVLWMTGMLSPVLFVLVGWLVRRTLARAAATPSLGLLTGVLAALAGGVSIVLVLVKRPLARWARHDPARFFVLRYAIAETVAVYGFLLFMLGAGWRIFLAFTVWALSLMALIRPTEDDDAQLAEWKRER
jgi:hypothetical protein